MMTEGMINFRGEYNTFEILEAGVMYNEYIVHVKFYDDKKIHKYQLTQGDNHLEYYFVHDNTRHYVS